MSMWLKLTKIEPALLMAVREGAVLSAFRTRADSYGCDHRILSTIAEGRAEAEEGTTDWTKAYPWLARSTGHGCAAVEEKEYESGYGPAFVLTPDEVRQVAEGLMAEGWATTGTTAADWTGESEDHGLEDLGPFFAAAAAEGKAVIGGVD
ncbi:hypothetical protein ACIQVK_52585 [Streptomyces sp. NPDC090493]|uniref:hypothetical protein n=1 Tax=Streptomyces sp. NPDC090493 TaxID=3365964 RepID=UPI003804CE16